MSNSQAFWDLHDRGLGLIPISPRSKGSPLLEWRKYHQERADAATIKGWLARWPNANPAIVTGRISGVIVLDGIGGRGDNAGRGGSGFRRKLGKALARRVDVRFGDLRLERASDDAHSKVSRWRVRDMRDMRG